MDGLPSEVLDLEILSLCAEYAPAVRQVCSAWRALPSAPRKSRGEGLTFLASQGHVALLAWVREHLTRGALGYRQYDRILRAAARAGHEAVCLEAQRWGATDCPAMLVAAARGGHEALCRTAKSWYERADAAGELNPTYHRGGHDVYGFAEAGTLIVYDDALAAAARGGHETICRLLRGWGARDYESMIKRAARGGHEALCLLAKDWALQETRRFDVSEATYMRRLAMFVLENAAHGGHRALCNLAKDWGVADFGGMLQGAARGGHVQLWLLAKEWSTQPLSHFFALDEAAHHGHLSCCRLIPPDDLKSTSMTRTAMTRAAESGHTSIMRWLKDYYVAARSTSDKAHIIEIDDIELSAALYAAIVGGHLEATQLLHSWGMKLCLSRDMVDVLAQSGRSAMMAYLRADSRVNDVLILHNVYTIGSAMASAAENDHLSTMRLMKEWLLRDLLVYDPEREPKLRAIYDDALVVAARHGSCRALCLLKEWGATDYTGALRIVGVAGCVDAEVRQLLLDWGALESPPDSVDTVD